MIDAKAAAGTIGAAAATLLWTLLAALVDRVADLGPETLATVTGATAILLAGVLAYRTPNAASPIPADLRPGSVEPVSPEEIARMISSR